MYCSWLGISGRVVKFQDYPSKKVFLMMLKEERIILFSGCKGTEQALAACSRRDTYASRSFDFRLVRQARSILYWSHGQ